jgi:hypothetical protein
MRACLRADGGAAVLSGSSNQTVAKNVAGAIRFGSGSEPIHLNQVSLAEVVGEWLARNLQQLWRDRG